MSCRTRKTRCERPPGSDACQKCISSGHADECIILESHTRPARGASVPLDNHPEPSKAPVRGRRNTCATQLATSTQQCSQKRQSVGPSQHKAKRQRRSESRDCTPGAQTSALSVHDGTQRLESIREIEDEPNDFATDSFPSDNVRGAGEWLSALSMGSGGQGDLDKEPDGYHGGDETDNDASDNSSDDQSDGDSDGSDLNEVTVFLNGKQRRKPTVARAPTKQKQQRGSRMSAADPQKAYDPLTCCKSRFTISSYKLYEY